MTSSFQQEKYKSCAQHLELAVVELDPDVDLAIDLSSSEDLSYKALLEKYDLIHDTYANSGGEPDGVRDPSMFWFHMAQALRFLVEE